jgi:hypothetical protein
MFGIEFGDNPTGCRSEALVQVASVIICNDPVSQFFLIGVDEQDVSVDRMPFFDPACGCR